MFGHALIGAKNRVGGVYLRRRYVSRTRPETSVYPVVKGGRGRVVFCLTFRVFPGALTGQRRGAVVIFHGQWIVIRDGPYLPTSRSLRFATAAGALITTSASSPPVPSGSVVLLRRLPMISPMEAQAGVISLGRY